jgi:hypothetical protein
VKIVSRYPLGDYGREDLWERVLQARRSGDARALGGWYWSALDCSSNIISGLAYHNEGVFLSFQTTLHEHKAVHT